MKYVDWEYEEEQKKEYSRLEKKLFSMYKKEEEDLQDFKIEDMTIIQLINRQGELKQKLYKRYSKREYAEYKKICKALNEEVIEPKMDFIEEQLEYETCKFLELFMNTLEYKQYVYEDFEEPYLFLKITLLKKLIKCLEREMKQNQDIVNKIIKDIKKKSREN